VSATATGIRLPSSFGVRPTRGSAVTNFRIPVPVTTCPAGSSTGNGLYAKFGTKPK
jgi:hypothetical protein